MFGLERESLSSAIVGAWSEIIKSTKRCESDMIAEQKQLGIIIYLFIAYVLLYFCVFELAAVARFMLWIVQRIN